MTLQTGNDADSMLGDAHWADQMSMDCHNLRMQWSEHGIDYLFVKNDCIPPPPPLHGPPPSPPEGHAVPQLGVPVFPRIQGPVPSDIVDEWHRVDDDLVELFLTKFRSGRLDATEDVLRELGQAPIGEDASLNEGQLTQKGEIDIGGAAYRTLQVIYRQLHEHWEGEAAEQFDIHLLELEYALSGCQDRIAATWRVAGAYKQALTNFRNDILKLVDEAYKLLEAESNEEEQINLNDLSTLINAGPAAVSIAAATAGAAAGLAYAALVGVLVAGGLGASILRVGGSTKGKIVYDVAVEGKKIVKYAENAAERLQEGCYTVTQHLTGSHLDVPDLSDVEFPRSKTLPLDGVRSRRPDIVTGDRFNPEEFRPDGQPEGDRAGISRDDLVEEPPEDDDYERDHHIKDPSPEKGPSEPSTDDAYAEQ